VPSERLDVDVHGARELARYDRVRLLRALAGVLLMEPQRGERGGGVLG